MVMFTNHKWKEIWWAVGEKTSKMSISGPITCVLRSFLLGTWTCSTSGACHLPPAKRATFSSTRLHGREGGQGRVGAAEEAQQETATWTTGKSPTCHVPWTLWAGAFQWLAAVPVVILDFGRGLTPGSYMACQNMQHSHSIWNLHFWLAFSG